MLSVIVCTYQRTETLGLCLQSLAQQALSAAEYEVVVVNNYPPQAASVRQLAGVVLALAHNWRVVEAPIPGLYHARNVGLAAARGEIVCFIDDDATANIDWLAQLARAYAEHPQAGVIGGHTLLTPPEPRPYVLQGGRERYWSHFVTPFSGYTEVENYWEFPWGANWSARRAALMDVGGFSTDFEGFAEFERQGLAVIGDDLLAASRIARLGYHVAVLPQAVVEHHVEPARFTLGHIRRRIQAGAVFRHLARHQLAESGATNYTRAKLPALFKRRGPLPLLLWEVACHLWAQLQVFGLRLRQL
jgi:glycosyltransferase involved in cell wall biosynthesis